MINVGDKVPEVTLFKAIEVKEDGSCPVPQRISTKELFENKKVVVFAVPGAFTPTCSGNHLPGFINNADEIRSKGVDEIVCLSVNDGFVMSYWGKEKKVGNKITMVGDGNGEFTTKIGLNMDGTNFGMGTLRSKRYAMIVENGIVKYLGVEEPGKLEVSSADNVLKQL